MIRDLGIVAPGSTLYLPFHSFSSDDPAASITLTGLATTDIEIYKNGSTTQRASDNGYALLDTDGIDFDGITGIHGISINLADNTTAGFYAAGSQYWVVISSVTIDAGTINFILATFRIGYPDAIINTTIATLASQTSFTLTNGPAEDDALNGMWCVIHDVASAVQLGTAVILDYTGSTRAVALAAGTTFTAAVADNISVMGPMPLQPATMGRTLQVESDGMAHSDLKEIAGDATSPTNLKQSLLATQVGTVQTAEAAANTATVFDTNLPLENANYYGSQDGGVVIAFIAGTAQKFQTRRIVASATGTLNTRITLEEALDGTPTVGDVFVALGRITELS